MNMREVDELIGQAQLDNLRDAPEMIVSGPWPGNVPGCRRVECHDCRGYVAVSPSSGEKALEKFPGTPVVCIACARERGAPI